MVRLSNVAWGTLFGASIAVVGCANVLGFQDFTDDAGPGGNNGSTGQSDSTSTGGGGTSTGHNGGSTSRSSGSGTTTPTMAMSGTSTPMGMSGSTTSKSTSVTMTTSHSSSSSANGPAGPCTFGTPFNGGGSFTYYYFGQGTYMQNGMYKTACGYNGSESGSGQGATDTVSNVANSSPAKNTYFAAIPGASSSNFDTVTSCGACVEITGQNGKKIVATVIDECPLSSNPLCTNGHLDLSTQAFDALGYSVGNPSGTTWKFVACPVTGNIQAVNNSQGQVYLQNSVYPISKVNGQGPTNYGYFNVGPGSATVTSDAANQTITINIPGSGGDTGNNFTQPSGCY